MPKKSKRSKTELADAPKLIQVDSLTYGKHTRAARGSKTAIKINEAVAAQSAKTSLLNTAAKAVYDVLKTYSQGFKEGQLWQAILSVCAKPTALNLKAYCKRCMDLSLTLLIH